MGQKIVVVDDDKDILAIMQYILVEEGYEPVPSLTSEILSKISEIKPELILLDIWLNDGDGADLCKGLKANPETQLIPVVLVSAINNLRERAHSCGADAFIEKPFNIDEIKKVLSEQLAANPL